METARNGEQAAAKRSLHQPGCRMLFTCCHRPHSSCPTSNRFVPRFHPRHSLAWCSAPSKPWHLRATVCYIHPQAQPSSISCPCANPMGLVQHIPHQSFSRSSAVAYFRPSRSFIWRSASSTSSSARRRCAAAATLVLRNPEKPYFRPSRSFIWRSASSTSSSARRRCAAAVTLELPGL